MKEQEKESEGQGLEHKRLLVIRDEVREMLDNPGWSHRGTIFNDLLERLGRSLEGAVDGFEIYRAQGGLKALMELQNSIIEASRYDEEEKYEDMG